MIKIPFFRKNLWQTDSAKVPIKYRRSRIVNLFERLTRYAPGTEPSLCVIQHLNSAVDLTEINSIRAGFYLINPRFVLCVKV